MAENIKRIIDSFAQVFPPTEDGEIHITGENRTKAFEVWGSELWSVYQWSARDVHSALEYANDKYFDPSFNVNQLNAKFFHLFASNAVTSPECWERDFPFVFAASNKSGAMEYKIDFKLLAAHIIKSGQYAFLNNSVYLYDNGVYTALCDDVFRGYVMSYVTALDCTLAKTSGIDGAVRDVKSDNGHRRNPSEFNSDENIINFQNGVLHLDTMELAPHSPDILSTIQIPCNWSIAEEFPVCPIFDGYLNDLANGDEEIIRFLWQYIGVTISNIPGYVTKSALFLYGAGNTGKSQFLELLSRLVGKANSTSIDLAELEERFGTFSLLHKRLAGSPDMSFAKVSEMKIFKKLVGGDDIGFEQKGKEKVIDKYKGVLLFCCNELPKFGGDKGDHVYERMIIINCRNIIPAEKRDCDLIKKMYAEREAIVFKAVRALKKFIANGKRFNIPKCCEAETKKYKVGNDNALRFLEECTIIRERNPSYNDVLTCGNMYRAYKSWVEEEGEAYKCPLSDFIKAACSFYGSADKDEARTSPQRGRRHYRFTLKPSYYHLCGYADL